MGPPGGDWGQEGPSFFNSSVGWGRGRQRGMASSATGFFQDPPALSNQFEDDAVLRSILAHASMPGDLYGEVVRDLTRFGAVVVDEVMLDAVADAEAHPPELVQYDAWGRRRDRIHTSAGWKHMKATSATEGLIAIAYDERYGRHARLYQFAKYYLFASSSAVYTCPLVGQQLSPLEPSRLPAQVSPRPWRTALHESSRFMVALMRHSERRSNA